MSGRITILLPNLTGGGAERLHVHLAQAWTDSGYDVQFALMSRYGVLLDALPESVRAIDLQAPRLRSLLLPLVRHFRETKPDVILAAMWPLTSVAILAWLLAGRPGRIFVSDHSHLSIAVVKEMGVPRWLTGGTIRLTYPHASGVIVVSEGVKRDMCELARLPSSRVKVIYNPAAIGVQPVAIDSATRTRLWGDGFEHHIVSVGTLKTPKDHRTLLHAFARVRRDLNAKLVILGDGPLRSELESLIRDLGLDGHISMPGFVLHPYPWYQTADLFVLSSRWEGFANVIVEALECGLRVVSTDCPSGPAEILKGGEFGTLVPIQDVAALGDAMQDALRSQVDRAALNRRAQDFSVPVIAAQYLDFFGLNAQERAATRDG